MANLLVLGSQWGDEGKGKIVDLLTPAFDIVARYQGGHNAGHTVYVNGKKIVLHLVPSGILHPGKVCIIGNGLVVSPEAFFRELGDLRNQGVEVDATRIVVSRNAHLIMPYHPLMEKISEEGRGEKKIGTTCRGIGPAYEDKAARWGIRAGDLLYPALLADKIRENVEVKNKLFAAYGIPLLDASGMVDEYTNYASRLAPYIRDASLYLDEAMKAGKRVLFEGAQGVLLDLDHGTYPFVTSSSSTAGGVATGLGVGPKSIHFILGITKAYTTRVGSGPFPTELSDEKGKLLAARGDEFGATTGRPRRCGWFDAVAVRYACRVNGIDRIALTKPDVLEGLGDVEICTAYRYKGAVLKEFPTEPYILAEVIPVYRKLPGWKDSVHGARKTAAFPAAFTDYVKVIEDLIETRVAIISTGVEREDTVIVEPGIEALAGPPSPRDGR
jgi:adenylosuccinate synthase